MASLITSNVSPLFTFLLFSMLYKVTWPEFITFIGTLFLLGLSIPLAEVYTSTFIIGSRAINIIILSSKTAYIILLLVLCLNLKTSVVLFSISLGNICIL